MFLIPQPVLVVPHCRLFTLRKCKIFVVNTDVHMRKYNTLILTFLGTIFYLQAFAALRLGEGMSKNDFRATNSIRCLSQSSVNG